MEHSYFTYGTQLLHTLNAITCYFYLETAKIEFRPLCPALSRFYSVLSSSPIPQIRPQQFRSTPFPAHHSLTILPFAVSSPDRVVNKKRKVVPVCATKARNGTGGRTPFMLKLSSQTGGEKDLRYPQNRSCVGPRACSEVL